MAECLRANLIGKDMQPDTPTQGIKVLVKAGAVGYKGSVEGRPLITEIEGEPRVLCITCQGRIQIQGVGVKLGKDRILSHSFGYQALHKAQNQQKYGRGLVYLVVHRLLTCYKKTTDGLGRSVNFTPKSAKTKEFKGNMKITVRLNGFWAFRHAMVHLVYIPYPSSNLIFNFLF